MTPRVRRTVVSATAVAEFAPRRLLLDTHVWLWWQKNDKKLGPRTRRLIAGASEVRFSVASAWEIAIKAALGKLKLPVGADIAEELAQSGFLEMPVALAHAEAVRQLPPIHRDPFDRMLVAQAGYEGLTLVTVDPEIRAYGISVHDATT